MYFNTYYINTVAVVGCVDKLISRFLVGYVLFFNSTLC